MIDIAETPALQETRRRFVARSGFTRGRILVVDDDASLRSLLEQGLERVGFEVINAVDGIDALSSMYARRPDALLVDLAMPRMSGFELIAQVCTERGFRDVTVVAMSGHEGMLHHATEVGASATILKPLSIRGIIAALPRQRRSSKDSVATG